MCRGGKYDQNTFKLHYLGFRYVKFTINVLSNKKRAIHHGLRKTHKLKVVYYGAHMIELNEYFFALPVAKACDNIGYTELNEIILNSIPNECSTQAYMQGFDCEYMI